MKRFLWRLWMIGGGFVAGINLVDLVPTNPDHHSTWLNVMIGVALAISGAIVSLQENEP